MFFLIWDYYHSKRKAVGAPPDTTSASKSVIGPITRSKSSSSGSEISAQASAGVPSTQTSATQIVGGRITRSKSGSSGELSAQIGESSSGASGQITTSIR